MIVGQGVDKVGSLAKAYFLTLIPYTLVSFFVFS